MAPRSDRGIREIIFPRERIEISEMMDTRPTSLILISIILIFSISTSGGNQSNGCNSELTCSDCIAKHQECAWCTQPNFEDSGHNRCDLLTELHRNKCGEKNIIFPTNEGDSRKDEKLSEKGTKSDDIIQVKPQHVYLKLRPHTPYPLVFKFRQVEDYPVDLYYLMDLSRSMQDDKVKLAELGNLLSDHMRIITSNFRLGFGSFVDKVVMPYTDTAPQKLISSCRGCAAPYGFRNHMPLSLNTSMFSRRVQQAPVSANLDSPEGGFDAIMQAMVCHKVIGWRQQSRKLLLFSTDSSFHAACDGKIGGIVEPNDGKCHLDNKGYYKESSNQDYPSLGHINKKAQDKNVNIIFAVTSNQVPTYQNVAHVIEGASSAELLDDSSNIVELIRKQYNAIVSHVEMKDTAPDYVNVTYFSKCLGDSKRSTNICKGLQIGTEVEFEAQIEVLRCPKERNLRKLNFTIHPVGLLEPLTVELDIACECDCEGPKNEERKSPVCSDGNGTYQCGVCECYSNRYGRYCECDKTNLQSKNDTDCYFGNDQYECSGRGSCECGVCKCKQKQKSGLVISGKWCECDNFSCDRYQGNICSGSDNGECVCGKCQCKNGRMGSACQCESSERCIEPGTEIECSGNGRCECGSCVCNEVSEGKFGGKYCQIHPIWKSTCKDFASCVLCDVHDAGDLYETTNDCNNCTDNINLKTVHVIKVNDSKRETLCLPDDENGCRYRFVYSFNDTLPVIIAEETKICPGSVNVLAIIVGVIAGIVLIGIVLLLIWKLLMTIHDRREYAKFEKEAESAKWDTGINPLFRGATSTFRNPTYGGKQH